MVNLHGAQSNGDKTRTDKQVSHHHHNHHSTLGLWMLVDGIGLAIIASATVMEGIHLWKEIFHELWDVNELSMMYWFGGRTLQVVGLMFLIGFAATFQMFPAIEEFGMFLITTGPLLNMVSCYLFRNPEDALFLYNKGWICTEIVEILGMLVLDISMIHMDEIYVLIAELVGFFLLCCAAALQFTYTAELPWPVVSARLDVVHSSECFGLILLSIVAIAQYQMKIHKLQHKNTHNNHINHKQHFSDNNMSTGTSTTSSDKCSRPSPVSVTEDVETGVLSVVIQSPPRVKKQQKSPHILTV